MHGRRILIMVPGYEKLDPTGMLQQIAARSTPGGWTLLCEPNKPVYLYLASEEANAMASFLVKKNGATAEKTPILMGMDAITGVQTSNIITILPNEEIVILLYSMWAMPLTLHALRHCRRSKWQRKWQRIFLAKMRNTLTF